MQLNCKNTVKMSAATRWLNFALINLSKNPSFGLFKITRLLSGSASSQPSETKDNQKCITVAVIGVPNAGKSTFINNLINHRICPTSNKVHTTRKQHKAIYTTKDTQVILFDTPGLVTEKEIKKYHLESTFSSSYRHSIQHAKLIAVIHDISNSFTRRELHPTVLKTLEAYPKVPSFLVLNKIDTLKSKRILLDLIRTLTNNTLSGKKKPAKPIEKPALTENNLPVSEKSLRGWSNFTNVFMVSSIMGDGLNEVMSHILCYANPGEWMYPSEVHTDDSPENIIVDSVRARLLDYLPQEIPYNLKSVLEYYSVEKNIIYASVQITCPSARIERLICGEANGKIKQITERVTSDLVETFRKPISLTIVTVAKKSAQASN